jgi:hypothetical protein
MIAERCVEGDAGLEERGVRPLEFIDVVLRLLASIHVVAEHDHELERESRAGGRHLLRDIELRPIAGAVVADDGKLDRVGPAGERGTLRRRRGGPDDQECEQPRDKTAGGRWVRGHGSGHSGT